MSKRACSRSVATPHLPRTAPPPVAVCPAHPSSTPKGGGLYRGRVAGWQCGWSYLVLPLLLCDMSGCPSRCAWQLLLYSTLLGSADVVVRPRLQWCALCSAALGSVCGAATRCVGERLSLRCARPLSLCGPPMYSGFGELASCAVWVRNVLPASEGLRLVGERVLGRWLVCFVCLWYF